MVYLRFLLVLLALTLVTACNSSGGPQVTGTIAEPYRLDAGDQLRIVVYNQPELTNIYGVEQAGFIAMPLIGNVPASGLTTAQLEVRIEAALAARFLRDPDVTVEVSARRPFFVMGEVNKAGQYPHLPALTVRSAVAVAGGYTARANDNLIMLARTADGQTSEYRVYPDEPVLPGDTITVEERLF